MTRALAVLILVVGGAGVVAAIAKAVDKTDSTTFTRPGPVAGLQVDVDAGRVRVVAGEGDAVTVHRTRRWALGPPPRATERTAGGVVELRSRCRAFRLLDCTVDYEVTVPAEVSVRVRTDAGAIDVADVVGPVDVRADAGAVHLARTAGSVRATTGGGSIDGDDLSPPALDVSTGAGSVTLTLARPPSRVEVRTSAGSIDLRLPPGTYRVDAHSDAGPVDVDVLQDPASPRAVILHSGAGGIGVHRR